jgi:hypothetical protein
MAGHAGKKALVKVAGAPAAFVTEACDDTGDGLSFQIAAAAKRVWDPTIAIMVYVDAVLQAADTYTLNRLTGTITFVDAPAGVVTVTGSYLPLSVAARGRAYSWSLNNSFVDDTDFDSANTDNGFQRKLQSLLDVTGSVTARWSDDMYFVNALLDDEYVVVEFYPDRTQPHDLIMWARLDKADLSAAVDSTIDRVVSLQGFTDADGRAASL